MARPSRKMCYPKRPGLITSYTLHRISIQLRPHTSSLTMSIKRFIMARPTEKARTASGIAHSSGHSKHGHGKRDKKDDKKKGKKDVVRHEVPDPPATRWILVWKCGACHEHNSSDFIICCATWGCGHPRDNCCTEQWIEVPVNL